MGEENLLRMKVFYDSPKTQSKDEQTLENPEQNNVQKQCKT